MTNNVLVQLAQTDLLPPALLALIASDNPPPLPELIYSLVVAAMDCHFMTLSDPKSDWNTKRASRGLLIATYLLALAFDNRNKPMGSSVVSGSGIGGNLVTSEHDGLTPDERERLQWCYTNLDQDHLAELEAEAYQRLRARREERC